MEIAKSYDLIKHERYDITSLTGTDDISNIEVTLWQ